MTVTQVLFIFAQALLIQCTLSQCIGRGYPGLDFSYDGLPFDGFGLGRCGGPFDFTATTGGTFPLSSLSPTTPIGLTVISDNIFEGTLFVTGEMPFVSAVSLDGVLPSTGAGAINYGCGNGITAMFSDISPDLGPAFAPVTGNFGYGYGCGDIFY